MRSLQFIFDCLSQKRVKNLSGRNTKPITLAIGFHQCVFSQSHTHLMTTQYDDRGQKKALLVLEEPLGHHSRNVEQKEMERNLNKHLFFIVLPSVVHLSASNHRMCSVLSESFIPKHYFVMSLFPQELQNLIPKSAVGTLSSNSSNVINLIIDAYNVSLILELLYFPYFLPLMVNL